LSIINSSLPARKAVTMGYNMRTGMFGLKVLPSKCTLYCHMPDESKYNLDLLWMKYAPTSIVDLQLFAKTIAKGKLSRVTVRKNFITMILLGSLEEYVTALTGDTLQNNGDLFYYYFQPDHWEKIYHVLASVIAPVAVEDFVIEIRPYCHATWETFFEDKRLQDHRNRSMLEIPEPKSEELMETDSIEIAIDKGESVERIPMKKPEQKLEVYEFEAAFVLSFKKNVI
jgi:hypothetical protein